MSKFVGAEAKQRVFIRELLAAARPQIRPLAPSFAVTFVKLFYNVSD